MNHPFFVQAIQEDKKVKKLVLSTLSQEVDSLVFVSPLVEHMILNKEVYWVARLQVLDQFNDCLLHAKVEACLESHT